MFFIAKSSTKVKEEHVEEDQNIKTADNKEAEVVETDSLVEKEIEAEYCLLDLIHSQKNLHIQYYASQQEILAEYDHIHGQIQITEDLHIQEYDAEDGEEELECKVEDDAISFTFHKKLGEGGFAEVLVASDIIRKKCVALKVSNKCLFTEHGYSFVERDILELSHESPFLIHGLAAFHTEKCVYYVLELATRGDLFDFLFKNFPLDTPTIQFIMAEVICGTQFLHKKNIIHRDLKPANILLTADGHIKITDFGFAVMGVYERIKENPKGTPGYFPPEMIMGKEHGRGADYFAIGVILYNLFTKKEAFPGENPMDIMLFTIEFDPLYPEFLTPVTVAILKELLCKDQDYRLGVRGDIKKHQFFSGINWEDVEARRMEPPAIMTAASVDVNTDQTLNYMEMPNSIRPEDQKIFTAFSFVCPDWSQQYHPVNNEAIH
ncbi:hypothetical protein GDO78_003437 [Eleutherodactylus coqui]|uniref:Protein kinase domain-containing protein n=1 Tax=Eleutherodactylus coqui TaxID=57060 RepID=A0A8J6ESA4_ELECQ|nr:hypothetical protein GDO78_003437 [Eleutherodactylus coqui]